jgi:hypothetical protein
LPPHGAPRLKILTGLRQLYFMPLPANIFRRIRKYFLELWLRNIFGPKILMIFLLKARQAQLAGLIGGGCSPEYAEKYD